MATAAAQPPNRDASFAMALTQASTAHAVSHFHIMTLPALLPFLPDHFGISFVQIGFAITVFSLVSLVVQIPLGFLTDRIGGRAMLIAGLLLGGLSFASLAWAHSYAGLLLAMAAAGLANGVYHPAGYALIASRVNPDKVGRSFSIYTFTGFLGTAVTPGFLYWIVVTADIQLAFLAAGLLGAAGALTLLVGSRGSGPISPAAGPSMPHELQGAETGRGIFNPAVGLVTVMFLLISLSSVGIHNFSVTALTSGYQLNLAVANWALTAFLFASAFGVLAGGFLADWSSHHGYIVSSALFVTAVLMALLATITLSGPVICSMMTIAGFFFGTIAPSRDMLVRAAAPKGAQGRVFGIASTGFNAGGVIGPVLFGILLDRNEPQLVFALVTAFILLTVAVACLQHRLRSSSP